MSRDESRLKILRFLKLGGLFGFLRQLFADIHSMEDIVHHGR